MDEPLHSHPWRVVRPLLASGVPIAPGAAVILSPAEATPLASAGFIVPLAALPAEGAIALGVLSEMRPDSTPLPDISQSNETTTDGKNRSKK